MTRRKLAKTPIHQPQQRGFTLLEVLLAVSIFALVSIAGVTVLQTAIKSDEGTQSKTERIHQLQRAFIMIERDFNQVARRHVRLDGDQSSQNFVHSDDSNNFRSQSQALAFVRQGWTNPGLLIPRSDLQSVAYRLNDQYLERLHFNFVDPVLGEEPKVRKLIGQVNDIRFEYHDGKKWQQQAPKGRLPYAIAIELDTEDMGKIRRQFLTPGDDGVTLNNLATSNAEQGTPP